MRWNLRLLFVAVAMLTAEFAPRAFGVIKVDLPVSQRYETSKTVVIGKVSAIDAEHQVVEVTTVERLKDETAPALFRIQFAVAPELIKSVAVGQPVVLLSKIKASIHIADTWLVATPKADATPPLWRVNIVDTNSAGKTFPGTTAALVKVLEEMKGGKSTLLDNFTAKLFTGDVKTVSKLDVAKPTFLLRADVNGDGKPDLIVGTSTGVKLFLATADSFTDATEKWGLKGIAATCASANETNADGKPDLLLDGTLYINDGQKFTAAPQAIALDPAAHIVASALADLTGGKKADAGFILSDGRLLVYKNAGPSAAWTKEIDRKLTTADGAVQAAAFGAFAEPGKVGVVILQEKSLTLFPIKADEPAADFLRLTGEDLQKIKGFGGAKHALAMLIDFNTDHRPGLLVVTDTGAMALINRGFGTFLPDVDAGAELAAAISKTATGGMAGVRGISAVQKAANRPEDLLVLGDDGVLLSVANAPATTK